MRIIKARYWVWDLAPALDFGGRNLKFEHFRSGRYPCLLLRSIHQGSYASPPQVAPADFRQTKPMMSHRRARPGKAAGWQRSNKCVSGVAVDTANFRPPEPDAQSSVRFVPWTTRQHNFADRDCHPRCERPTPPHQSAATGFRSRLVLDRSCGDRLFYHAAHEHAPIGLHLANNSSLIG